MSSRLKGIGYTGEWFYEIWQHNPPVRECTIEFVKSYYEQSPYSLNNGPVHIYWENFDEIQKD